MITFDHVNPNYSDFVYRLEDFFKILGQGNDKITKTDAVVLYSMVRGVKPIRALEIGRSFGTSSMILCGAMNDNGFGKLDSVDIVDTIKPEIRELTANFLIEHIIDSKVIKTYDALKDKKYQFFFVDGDHSLEYQILDIETCLELSDSQAWIILHDADMQETVDAANYCCKKHTTLIDVGKLGDQLYMIVVKK